MTKEKLSAMERDAIGEILNISFGASATAVSTMLDRRVTITVPVVEELTKDEFEFTSMEPAVGVEITYTEGLDGSNVMLLKRSDVKIIVGILMGMEIPDEEFELNELYMSAICEVMNQMMGASATALADFLGYTVNITTPVSFEVDDSGKFKSKYVKQTEPFVVVRFRLGIGDVVDSEFLIILEFALAKRLIAGFMGGEAQVEEAPAQPQPAPVQPQPQPAPPPQQPQYQPQPEPQYQPQPQPQYQPPPPPPPAQPQPKVINVQPVVRNPYDSPGGASGSAVSREQERNLDLIMSVPLQVSVEIGRTKKYVREILEFTQGTLVVLDKLAGEQVDLFVNGQRVAKGDVVVVDDSFGIRITEILSGRNALVEEMHNNS